MDHPCALPWQLCIWQGEHQGPGNYVGGLTFVAGCPGLVAIVACDAQDALLDGCESHRSTGEVLHRAGPFQILLDSLVYDQVLELPELRADVGQSPRADVR